MKALELHQQASNHCDDDDALLKAATLHNMAEIYANKGQVDHLIATGSFQTAEQVMQVALKLLEQERQSYQSWVIETREKVREGIESLDRGEGVDGETVVNDLLAMMI